MSGLHSHAPAHSLAATKRIIRKAFGGRRFEDIFAEFDPTPLGVGAIAQVYRARLQPDLAVPSDAATNVNANAATSADAAALEDGPGRKPQLGKRVVGALVQRGPARNAPPPPSSYVAIKVLHPRVERTVRRDLAILRVFAAAVDALPTMEWLALPDEVAQFGEMMRLQLDLRIEAANLTVFRRNFAGRPAAWFPYPYADYTSRRVLVEEFAQGIPLDAFLDNGGGVFQKALAAEGLDAFLVSGILLFSRIDPFFNPRVGPFLS